MTVPSSDMLQEAMQHVEAGRSPAEAVERLRRSGRFDPASLDDLASELELAIGLGQIDAPRPGAHLLARLRADDLPTVDSHALRSHLAQRFVFAWRANAMRLAAATVAISLALSASIVILASAPPLGGPIGRLQELSRTARDMARGEGETTSEVEPPTRLTESPLVTPIPREASRQARSTGIENRAANDAGDLAAAQADGGLAAAGDRASGLALPRGTQTVVPSTDARVSPSPTVVIVAATAAPIAPPTATTFLGDDPSPTATAAPPEEPPPSNTAQPTAEPPSTPSDPVPPSRTPPAMVPSPSPQPTQGVCLVLPGRLIDIFDRPTSGPVTLELLAGPQSTNAVTPEVIASFPVSSDSFSLQVSGPSCERIPSSGRLYLVARGAGNSLVGWQGSWEGGLQPVAADPSGSLAATVTLFVDARIGNSPGCQSPGTGRVAGEVRMNAIPAGGIRVRLDAMSAGGALESRFVETEPASGRFELRKLCDGSYLLSASLPLSPGPAFTRHGSTIVIDPTRRQWQGITLDLLRLFGSGLVGQWPW